MHLSEGILRARVDGELASADAIAVERHLAGCERCRERDGEVRARAAKVQALLGGPVTAAVNTEAALSRVQARLESPRAGFFWWKPAWGLAASAAIIAVLFTSGPARAVAQKVLGFLRVKAVVAVPIERDFLGEGKGQTMRDLLSDSSTLTKDEKAMPASNREEASQLAGFTVKLPGLRQDTPRLRVEGARTFYLTVKRERVQQFLTLVNRPDLPLPEGLDGAHVQFEIPRAAGAVYGDCPKDGGPLAEPSKALSCVILMQAPAVTVITHPELDLAQLAEVGLQVGGMTPEQARDFGRAIDWTSTLAVPVPREAAAHETVEVNGARGILIEGRQYMNWPQRWSLIWVKDGTMYWLSGFGDASMALQLAESMA